MEFRVENGKGYITFKSIDIGYYLSFYEPIAIVWSGYDNFYSDYVSLLPINDEDRLAIQKVIPKNLEEDFLNKPDELYQSLNPLFQLFANGKYRIDFVSKDFFKGSYIKDNVEHQYYRPLEIKFAEVAYVEKASDKLKEFKDFQNSGKEFYQFKNAKYYNPDILKFTTTVLPEEEREFLATKSEDSIDEERVKYYEELIQNGKNPLAILFTQEIYDEDIHYFVLDGHHKLLAYKKLNIYPPLCIITHLPDYITFGKSDIEKILNVLYPWQASHILKNWYGKAQFIIPLLNNPDSNLHKFIRSGFVKEYHENGQLKRHGFYILDRPEGQVKEWYENGNLRSEGFYFQRKRVGVWKYYYSSGKLKNVNSFNKYHRFTGENISYYESGQISYISNYIDGKKKDGLSDRSFFDTGDKREEFSYKDDKLIEKKVWDDYGEFIIHEVFDESTQKFIKVDIPEKDKYDWHSVNYKNRQKEILENREKFRKTWYEKERAEKIKKLQEELDLLDVEFYIKTGFIGIIIIIFILGIIAHTN